MKKLLIGSLVAALSLSATSALAQQNTMQGMDNMSAKAETSEQQSVHAAKGKVVNVDVSGRAVTLAHGPVKSLDWPAMTMRFSVKDESLFDKLVAGDTVEFEFIQTDKGYVVTAVK